MSDFGDSEPEDAWHPDDPLHVLIDNVRRRVALLAAAPTKGEHEIRRAWLIDDDLRFIAQRILDEVADG